MNISDTKIAYFAGEPLGVPVLTELHSAGIVPNIILCNPDRPVGRKRILTPPPVKQWALKHNIPALQPESYTHPEGMLPLQGEVKENHEGIAFLQGQKWDLFVVVAYNHILPKWIIELPKYGTINVHPSLLPLLRGASPIRSAILNDMRDQIGVSVMLLDEKMDHGPILAQETLSIPEQQWPIAGGVLDTKLAHLGGTLLAQTIPKYLNGEITPTEQDHNNATYCGRLDRSMGVLDIDPLNLPSGDKAYQALLKIRAFDGFPGTFFMYKGKRIKVLDAYISKGFLYITRIIPEGKKEMDFDTFLRSIAP